MKTLFAIFFNLCLCFTSQFTYAAEGAGCSDEAAKIAMDGGPTVLTSVVEFKNAKFGIYNRTVEVVRLRASDSGLFVTFIDAQARRDRARSAELPVASNIAHDSVRLEDLLSRATEKSGYVLSHIVIEKGTVVGAKIWTTDGVGDFRANDAVLSKSKTEIGIVHAISTFQLGTTPRGVTFAEPALNIYLLVGTGRSTSWVRAAISSNEGLRSIQVLALQSLGKTVSITTDASGYVSSIRVGDRD